jgi:hypothetical protein
VVEEPQIVFHKAHQPDFVADLFDPDVLPGEYGAEVNFAPSYADTAAVGDRDGAVVEGILQLANATVGPVGLGLHKALRAPIHNRQDQELAGSRSSSRFKCPRCEA